MIRWFSLLVTVVLVVLATLFAATNQAEVTILIPGGLTWERIPLYSLVLVPLLIGLLIGAAGAWLAGLRHRNEAKRLLRQNRALEAELTNLRNLPLDNDTHF